MKTKTFLFATTFAMMAACMGVNTSCSKLMMDDAVENGNGDADGSQATPAGKEHVKLNFSTSLPTVETSGARGSHGANGTRGVDGTAGVAGTRASLQADGKDMTDIYIFDYDKTSGKLLQVLHQTDSSSDFAQPDMTLAYGDHTLKVIATRSLSPTLTDAEKTTWAVADNVLTAVGDATPAIWTSEKTSDSFGAIKDISVVAGKVQMVNIALERIVAKLILNCTETYPEDCNTMVAEFNEYKDFSLSSFDVMSAVKNQRTYDVTPYAGLSGKGVYYYVLVPQTGYTTDIAVTMTRKNSEKPYSQFTITDVPLERNKVTTVKGQYYSHQSGITFSLKSEWDKNGNDIAI